LTAYVYKAYIDETDSLYEYAAEIPDFWPFFSSDVSGSRLE
jgi:hypothetical protein